MAAVDEREQIVVDLSDWTKRREIIIDNQLQEELTDHQTLLVIPYDSDMQLDFEDLRFTNEAGDMLLPYWIETYDTPVNVTLFVRIPNIPIDQVFSIYVYYGNPNATSASDGVATFDFFDSFDGPNLDQSMWTATEGVQSLENGYLRIQQGAVYTNDFALHDTGRIETKFRMGNDQNVVLGSGLAAMRGQGSNSNLGQVWLWNNSQYFYVHVEELGNQPIPNTNIYGACENGPWIHSSIVFEEDGLVFYRCRDYGNSFDVVWPGDFFVSLGHLWGKDANQFNNQDIDFDFVLRRNYAEIEPDYLVGGEENI